VGKWTKQNFFKGWSPNGQKTHEKSLPSLAIEEMQIKTTLDSTSLLLEWLASRTPPTAYVGKDMGKKEPSYTPGGNAS
jgi:hypothetical protein